MVFHCIVRSRLKKRAFLWLMPASPLLQAQWTRIAGADPVAGLFWQNKYKRKPSSQWMFAFKGFI